MSLRAATLILIGLLALAGGLCLYVSIRGSEWFFRSASVRALTSRLERRSARLIYAAIGICILCMVGRMIADLY